MAWQYQQKIRWNDLKCREIVSVTDNVIVFNLLGCCQMLMTMSFHVNLPFGGSPTSKKYAAENCSGFLIANQRP
jgi:hypothetical protein